MQYIQGNSRHQTYFSTPENKVSADNPVRLNTAHAARKYFAPHEKKSPNLCNIIDTNERKIIAKINNGVTKSKKTFDRQYCIN